MRSGAVASRQEQPAASGESGSLRTDRRSRFAAASSLRRDARLELMVVGASIAGILAGLPHAGTSKTRNRSEGRPNSSTQRTRTSDTRRRLGIASACVMVLVAASSCGTANPGSGLADVDGAIYYESGGATGSGKPVLHGPESGTVAILKADGTRVARAILNHESFALAIPEGTYSMRAKSGRAHCRDVHIHGQAGHVLHANVICTVG